MRQKRDKKLNFYKISGGVIAGSILIFALIALFMKPFGSRAESSMEINGNGVLVRYNIKDGMTQVSIPGNVRAIGDQAFMGDKTLERIYIPGEVRVIGSKAFYGCDHLMEINIQNGTETIKDSAFAMCTSMSRSQLPSSLRSLGNGVFAGDSALNRVSIEEGNREFFINDNVIYNRDSTRIIEMIPGRQNESYEMPFSVRSIAPYAFWGAENLKNVRVSNQVTDITPFAFTNASSLEFVYLPNSVRSIQEYAFRNCSSLKTVAAEGKISYIDDSAFSGVYPEFSYEESMSFSEAVGKTGVTMEVEAGDSPPSVSSNTIDTPDEDGSNGNDGDEKAEDKKEGSTENGGSVVFSTPWGTRAPYREIDTSDPALYGTGKIVGGRTVIIPTEKQDYSGVSANRH